MGFHNKSSRIIPWILVCVWSCGWFHMISSVSGWFHKLWDLDLVFLFFQWRTWGGSLAQKTSSVPVPVGSPLGPQTQQQSQRSITPEHQQQLGISWRCPEWFWPSHSGIAVIAFCRGLKWLKKCGNCRNTAGSMGKSSPKLPLPSQTKTFHIRQPVIGEHAWVESGFVQP